MGGILKTLLKEGTVSFFALLVLLLLIWFGAQYAEESRTAPAILKTIAAWKYPILLGLLAIWVGAYVAQRVIAIRNAMAIEKRLTQDAQAQLESARPDQTPEVHELQARLQEAIQTLKASRLGKGALHRLPWYVIIGPPGSGKTTALTESGLNFPYATQGTNKLRGVGGTRNCDAWFTDEGILLDTAGRYTTELEDRDEWLGFLDLLAKSRKHKPINGAIVAMSVSDLLGATEEEIERHAENVRGRLDELAQRLQVVFPVYVLFTKCDLLQGFVDFFGELSTDQRAEIWGCTLPVGATRAVDKAFEEEARRLFAALCARRTQLLASERAMEAKERIHAFPLQFALTIPRLERFLGLVFRGSAFEESGVCRGFYFTSGTQEGNPIDQVLAALVRATRGDLPAKTTAAAGAQVEKKSYFLNHLFRRVIFPDQALARRTTKLEQRMRIARYAGSAAALIIGGLVCAGLAFSYGANQRFVTNLLALVPAGATSSATTSATASSPLSRPAAEIAARLGKLDQLRTGIEEVRAGIPWTRGFGLSQHGAIEAPVLAAYFREIKTLFLDGCLALFRADIDAWKRQSEVEARGSSLGVTEPPLLMRSLAGAAILGGGARCEPSELKELLAEGPWLRAVGVANAAGEHEVVRQARANFDCFMRELERRPDQAKSLFTESLSGEEREHHRQLAHTAGVRSSYREMIQAAGPPYEGAHFLEEVRKDRNPRLEVNAQLPRAFTQQGFESFQSSLPSKAAQHVRFAELVGVEGRRTAEIESESEFRKLYDGDYVMQWKRLLHSIRAQPFVHVSDAVLALKTFEDKQTSPIKIVLEKMWEVRKRYFVEPKPSGGGKGDAKDDAKTERGDQNVVKGTEQTINEDMLLGALAALAPVRASLELFRPGPTGEPEVRHGLRSKSAEQLRAELLKAKDEARKAIHSGSDLDKAAVAALLDHVLTRVDERVVSSARDEALKLWETSVAKPFREKLADKFPFRKDIDQYASLKDITAMFSPKDGALWKARESLDAYSALVPVSKTLDEDLKPAMTLRQTLFQDDGTLLVKLELRLKHEGDVDYLKLNLGSRTIDNRLRAGYVPLSWPEPGNCQGNLIVHLHGVSKTPSVQISSDHADWGLVKLLSGCAQEVPRLESDRAKQATEFAWTQKFTNNLGSEIGPFRVAILVVPPLGKDKVNPFVHDFFARFQCPTEHQVLGK